MASTLGDLIVNITANTKDFDKGIASTQKQAVKTEAGFKSATTAIKGLVGGVAVAVLVKKLAEVAIAVVGVASEAEETQAKFNTAFRGIEKSAENAADSLATNYGLARDEAKKLLSGTGDLVKGFGATASEALEISTSVQEMSVDLASYNNLQGGATQASEILTKAFLGERDSLVSLGIKISEADVKQKLLETGQQDLTGSALLLAKGQITLALATEQSADAQGDFERTSDSMANKTRTAEASIRDLKVEMGRALLPTATAVTSIFGELTGKLADYIRGINDVRAAEKARDLGIATKQQEVLLEEQKLKVNNKQLDALFLQARKEESAFGEAYQNTVDMIEILQTKNYRINQTIDLLEGEAKAEAEVIQEKERAEAIALANARKEEERQRVSRIAYEGTISDIEGVITASKSQIDVIDEEIATLKLFEAKDTEARRKQLEAIKILEKEKKEILDQETADKKEALEKQATTTQEFYANVLKEASENRKKLKEEKEKELEDTVKLYGGYAVSILDIFNNINQTRLNNIDSEKNAEIEALDQSVLSEEEYSDKVDEINKERAKEKYEIELQQFKAEKASASIEAGIATALGVTKALPNLVLAGLVGLSGLAQIATINSAPDPIKPAFAQGGVVTGATQALVGEDRGEVMLGMGAKGSPLIDELANRIASKSGSGIVINLNGNGMFSRQDLDNFAEKIYTSTVKVQQRRGIN